MHFFGGGGGGRRGCFASYVCVSWFVAFWFLSFRVVSKMAFAPWKKGILERTPKLNLGSSFVVDIVNWFLFLLLLLMFTFVVVGVVALCAYSCVFVVFSLSIYIYIYTHVYITLSLSFLGCCCYYRFGCLLCLFLEEHFILGAAVLALFVCFVTCGCSCSVLMLFVGVLVVAVERICLFRLCLIPMFKTRIISICLVVWFLKPIFFFCSTL